MTPKVNAVRNAYSILKHLADLSMPAGVSDIARETGISPSSCYNILKTMVDLGLVGFQQHTKRYELGIGIFELAKNGMTNRKILATAQPILTSLAEEYSCQTGLWEYFEGNRILLAMGESQTIARLNIQVGQIIPVGAGSAGRALMAKYLHDPKKLKAAFDLVDWRGDITFEDYLTDIRNTIQDGYSIDRNKLYPGVTTISSAFEDVVAQRQYCISLFLLSPAYPARTLKKLGEKLRANVEIIRTATVTKD